MRVVVLTSFADQRARARQAVEAGAVGYVLKDCDAGRAARGGPRRGRPATPRSTRGWPARCCPSRQPQPAADLLSARETEVLRARPAQGLANKQIARSLGIAERTVKVHLGNVFRRIGVQRPDVGRAVGPRAPRRPTARGTAQG